MSKNKLTEIKINNLKNDNFVFSKQSENLILEKGKINFIYANNGVGKTTIYEILLEEESGFNKFNLEENTFLTEKNKLLISPNIDEIEKLKNENEKFKQDISNIVKKWIFENNFSNGSQTIWTKQIKPYLDRISNSFPEFIFSKKMNENLKLDWETIKKINQWIKSTKFFSTIDNEFLEEENKINWKIISQYKFIDIWTLFERTKEALKNIKEKLTNEFNKEIKVIYKNLEIDISLLSCISDCVNSSSLKIMENCYLCSSDILNDSDKEINNFEKIKTDLQDKLEKLKNSYEKEFNISDDLKKIDSIFSTKIYEMFLKSNYENIINNKIQTEIEKTINGYKIKLETSILQLKSIFKDEVENKLEVFENNTKQINKLEKEQKLKVLSEDDFNIATSIVKQVIGDDKLKINKNSKNIIEVIGADEYDEFLPLSSGEEKLVKFIFNLFIYISDEENDHKNTFLLIDETEELFDDLNRINICYIINLFFTEYNVNFLILTNKYLLIKESWDCLNQDIELTLFFKDINQKRLFKKTKINKKEKNESEIHFLGFRSGLKLLRKTISNYLIDTKHNDNDKVVIFLYLSWLLRIQDFIFMGNTENSSAIQLLKYNFLFSNQPDENIFKSCLQKINNFLDLKTDFINFNNFSIALKTLESNLKEINIEIFKNYPIVQNNIINLVKVLFLREKIRQFIDSKWKNKKSENSYRKKIKNLIDSNFNSLEKREVYKWMRYMINLLDYIFHNEANPSLLLKGIELNKFFMDGLIDKFNDLIENITD